jgi:hypothetical protein
MGENEQDVSQGGFIEVFCPLAISYPQLDQILYSPYPNPLSRQAPIFEQLPIEHGSILG